MTLSNYGIKILKEGKDTKSVNPTDYIFNSNYQSLPLLGKSSVTAGSNTTTDITHGFDFPVFTIGVVRNSYGSGSVNYTIPVSMAGGSSGLYPGYFIMDYLTMTIDKDKVQIYTECYAYGGGPVININFTYNIDLYYYLFELGSLMV